MTSALPLEGLRVLELGHIIAGPSAGLLLADPHGRLQYMASSATSVKLLELFQLQYQEGPCLECYSTGRAITNVALSEATTRWNGSRRTSEAPTARSSSTRAPSTVT